MSSLADATVREQLLARRDRLVSAVQPDHDHRFLALLQEVDAALERVDAGTFGICDVCHGKVEAGRLLHDPLVRVCLECLTPDETRRLERDLEAAARIQTGLLPPRELAHDGWRMAYRYEPFGPVSGDYCDVIRPDRPDGDLYVVFGDVAGKGVAASLLMTHLHAMFRALVALDLAMPELVARANRLFSESTLDKDYATLVIARLSASGDVELANLAHCPPLLLTDRGIRAIGTTGYPLGLFPSAAAGTERVSLGSGDRLLLYTDGLSEAENARGEEYGADRIAHAARRAGAESPAAAIQACLEDWKAFRNGADRHDDVTVMAISRG